MYLCACLPNKPLDRLIIIQTSPAPIRSPTSILRLKAQTRKKNPPRILSAAPQEKTYRRLDTENRRPKFDFQRNRALSLSLSRATLYTGASSLDVTASISLLRAYTKLSRARLSSLSSASISYTERTFSAE